MQQARRHLQPCNFCFLRRHPHAPYWPRGVIGSRSDLLHLFLVLTPTFASPHALFSQTNSVPQPLFHYLSLRSLFPVSETHDSPSLNNSHRIPVPSAAVFGSYLRSYPLLWVTMGDYPLRRHSVPWHPGLEGLLVSCYLSSYYMASRSPVPQPLQRGPVVLLHQAFSRGHTHTGCILRQCC